MRLLINPFRPKAQFPECFFKNIFKFAQLCFNTYSLMVQGRV